MPVGARAEIGSWDKNPAINGMMLLFGEEASIKYQDQILVVKLRERTVKVAGREFVRRDKLSTIMVAEGPPREHKPVDLQRASEYILGWDISID